MQFTEFEQQFSVDSIEALTALARRFGRPADAITSRPVSGYIDTETTPTTFLDHDLLLRFRYGGSSLCGREVYPTCFCIKSNASIWSGFDGKDMEYAARLELESDAMSVRTLDLDAARQSR